MKSCFSNSFTNSAPGESVSKKQVMFDAVVIDNGRITIKKAVRDANGFDKGDKLRLLLVEHFKYVKKTEVKKT